MTNRTERRPSQSGWERMTGSRKEEDRMKWHEIPEALEAGRAVFVTDGTVTRKVLKAEWVCMEIHLVLDNGRSLWLSSEDFEGSEIGIGILESEEGVYIAPLWWIRIGSEEWKESVNNG